RDRAGDRGRGACAAARFARGRRDRRRRGELRRPQRGAERLRRFRPGDRGRHQLRRRGELRGPERGAVDVRGSGRARRLAARGAVTVIRRGFTLIEALVTVAVLATLLGVLMPALGSSRAAARAARCASNARQLSVANTAYSAEHAGRSVAGAARAASSNLHRWHGRRSSAQAPFDPARGDLTPYLGGAASSEGVRACPEFHGTLEAL